MSSGVRNFAKFAAIAAACFVGLSIAVLLGGLAVSALLGAPLVIGGVLSVAITCAVAATSCLMAYKMTFGKQDGGDTAMPASPGAETVGTNRGQQRGVDGPGVGTEQIPSYAPVTPSVPANARSKDYMLGA